MSAFAAIALRRPRSEHRVPVGAAALVAVTMALRAYAPLIDPIVPPSAGGRTNPPILITSNFTRECPQGAIPC